MLLLVAMWLLPLTAVSAESNRGQVLILRSDPAPQDPALQGHVDAALEAALTNSGFAKPTLSPVPLEELELATGCTRKAPECLRELSAALDAEWILIRTLSADSVGNYQLSLMAQHGADRRQLRTAAGTLDPQDQEAPDKLVRELVRLVFPGRMREASSVPGPPAPKPAPVVPALAPASAADDPQPISAPDMGSPPPLELGPPPAQVHQRRTREKRGLKIAGWSSVGSAAALLATGIGLGAAASHRLDDYEHQQVNSPETAAHARDLHDRAERLTHSANGLVIASASLAAVGVSLLIWDGVRERRSKHALRLSLHYAGSGMLLQLQGKLGRDAK
jgi:hypothetical protein